MFENVKTCQFHIFYDPINMSAGPEKDQVWTYCAGASSLAVAVSAVLLGPVVDVVVSNGPG